ncbi:MAG: short-chain dehydrogenase [delta proteobacterium ML8_D]|nr:MAG: short-chain dehydrogenase [delta proteobacterium ML8_D]
MKRLEGCVAIVTGGARGIGKAVSELFAEHGAKTVVTDILDDEGRKLVSEIKDRGGKAEFFHLDTSQEKQVREVMSQVNNTFGGIQVLVNNAGISGPNKPTHEIELEEWQRLIDINLNGVFLCTKHVIPYMKQGKGGSIINLSSIYGIIGAPDLPAYHASKGAVRLMSKTDALLYAADRIRVNSIHPGYIWTPLVEDLGRKSPEGLEEFRRKLDNLHPIGHVGDPMDIAYGALYLASAESKFVTGSELVIDGGYTAQ